MCCGCYLPSLYWRKDIDYGFGVVSRKYLCGLVVVTDYALLDMRVIDLCHRVTIVFSRFVNFYYWVRPFHVNHS